MQSIEATSDQYLSRAELASAGLDIPESARIRVRRAVIGDGVSIGEQVRLAGDVLTLGDGVVIAAEVDIRSAEISLGSRCEVGRQTRVLCSDSFALGTAGRIAASVEVLCRSFSAGSLFFMGNDASVGYGGTTEEGSHVRIGDRVAIGPFSVLNANKRITLSDDVGTGGHVTLWTHGFHFAHSVLDGFSAVFEPIFVERKVWLGYHASVMPGVVVGEGCIVAAGAVVTQSSEPWHLLAGVPARSKALLEARALDPRDAERVVTEVLERWAKEFIYKTGEAVNRDGNVWYLQYEGRRYAVALGDALVAPETDRRILVFIEGDKSSGEKPNETIFILRRRALTGLLDEVAEDLRDHLRRHTMPCGTNTTFRSIPPRGFARWHDVFDD